MDKAFDLKDLEAKLKEKGLPVLEQGAGEAINAVFEWVDESIDKSDTKYDDFLKPVSKVLKEFILGKVGHISSSPQTKALEAPKTEAKPTGLKPGEEGTIEKPIVRTSTA